MVQALGWLLAAIGMASASAYLLVSWRLTRRGARVPRAIECAFSAYAILLFTATLVCFAVSY